MCRRLRQPMARAFAGPPMKGERMIFELDRNWNLHIDSANPSGLEIRRVDGKFFKVVFNTTKYGLPLIVEASVPDGCAGQVIPLVRRKKQKVVAGGRRRPLSLFDAEVAVTSNERPANNYAEPLIEASRKSATNDNPYLSTDGHTVILLGRNYCNSARIAGQLQFGIVDVTDVAEYVLPANAQWLSFADFSVKSTDAMTKAALFDYLLFQHFHLVH